MSEEAATLPEQWPMWGIPVMPVAEGIIWHKKTDYSSFTCFWSLESDTRGVSPGYSPGIIVKCLKSYTGIMKNETLGLFYLSVTYPLLICWWIYSCVLYCSTCVNLILIILFLILLKVLKKYVIKSEVQKNLPTIC